MKYFICNNCKKKVNLNAPGTKNRNHCPYCLFSIHIDIDKGDRKNKCMGLMGPIGKYLKPDGEEVIIHECSKCGFLSKNRVAGDDSWELVEQLNVLDREEFGF